MLKKAFANSLEELAEIVKRGMFWDKCELLPGGIVQNGKGIVRWCHWKKRGNRYGFYCDI